MTIKGQNLLKSKQQVYNHEGLLLAETVSLVVTSPHTHHTIAVTHITPHSISFYPSWFISIVIDTTKRTTEPVFNRYVASG